MKKEMLINVMQPEECRIAILENGVLEELYIERASQENFVGNIYKGRIVNIEPSIQAAFVDFGVGRNGFLHISDVEPAYYRHLDPEGSKYDTGDDEPRGDSGPKRRDGNRPTGSSSGRGRDSGPRSSGGRGGRSADRDQERKKQLYQDLAEDLESLSPHANPETGADQPDRPTSLDFGDQVPNETEKKVDSRDQGGRRRGGRSTRGRRAILDSGASPEEEGQGRYPNQTEPSSRDNNEGKTPPPFMGSTEHRTSPPEDDGFDDLVFTPKKAQEIANTQSDGSSSPISVKEQSIPQSKPVAKVTVVEQQSKTASALDEEDLVFTPRQNLVGEAPAPLISKPSGAPPSEQSVRISPRVIQLEVATTSPAAEGETGEDDLLFQSKDVSNWTTESNRLAPDMAEGTLEKSEFSPERDQRPGFRRERENRGQSDRGFRDPNENGNRERPGEPGRNDPRQRPRRPSRDSGRVGGGEKPKPPIQDVFKRGQEVIVQVIKEGIGNKGPTLSTYISIAGRYLVLMPGMNRIGVSRKILDDEHRRRSKEIFNDLKPPKGLGFIIRTAGVGKSKMELQRDLAYLSRLWQVVARRVKKVKSPAEVFQESDIITRTIRDTFSTDIETIWVDDRAAFEHAQEFMHFVMPKYAERIRFHEGRDPLFHKFGIEEEITKMHQKKVPLPNGGSIIIEQTEALVAIDVNSGNFRTDGNNSEETAYQMNLAAAKEIGRQLRLRDLGGVIINDFIDMREEKHRRGVEKAMREAVRRDRARTKVLRISAFGLIEMTRQRIRPSLKRSLFTDCPACRSFGYVKTVESMSLEALRLLQLSTCKDMVSHVLLRLPNTVAEYLLNRKRKELHRLEELGNMNIEILGVQATNPEFIEMTAFDQNRNEVRIQPIQPEPSGPRQMRR